MNTTECKPAYSSEVKFQGVIKAYPPKSLENPEAYPLFRITTRNLCPLALQTGYLETRPPGKGDKLAAMVNSGAVRDVLITGPFNLGPFGLDKDAFYRLFRVTDTTDTETTDITDPRPDELACLVPAIGQTKQKDTGMGKNPSVETKK